jgi:hypothetical protein
MLTPRTLCKPVSVELCKLCTMLMCGGVKLWVNLVQWAMFKSFVMAMCLFHSIFGSGQLWFSYLGGFLIH